MLKAAQIMVADGCKSTADALRMAGYSEAVARNPSKVTESRTFQDALANLMPDESLVQKQAELLESGSLAYFDFNGSSFEEVKKMIDEIPGCRFITAEKIKPKLTKEVLRVYYISPNGQTQLKALDMIYRATGRYSKADKETKQDFSLSDLRKTEDVGRE
jgi:hypothetical protein